ncbi:endolytic transglycosylase MltG [Frondihabitans peucedani]|uniref:Endolytic murein transglycosylase n=1 Tax=Frondihabitans peucedani TaxID=598626 RepID=A0ABP8DXX2_9MICO
MADEPSWDEIFPGPPAARSDGRPRAQAAPLSRRELRERERAAEAAAAERVQQQQAAAQQRQAAAQQPAPADDDLFALANAVAPPARSDTTTSASRATTGAPSPQSSAEYGSAPQLPADPQDGGRPPRSSRRRTPGGRRRPHRGTYILIAVLVLVLGGGAAVASTLYNQYGPGISALFGSKESDDYTGSGNGTKVDFTIVPGDIGSTISKNLAKAGITKSSAAPYQILLADTTIQFQPGTYSMFEHMSAQSAIDRLQLASARITTKLVIPEGTTLKGIIQLMAATTKIPVTQVTAAAADYKSYGLPSNASSLEGYLFPATYDLQPGNTAKQYFQEMVDTMKKHLADAGVAPANYEHTIIFASLIQKEAGLAADYPKVARVFQNRIDQGMLLQSDATVAYGAGTTGRVTTTDAERADASNKYNTYVHKGLPVGPISNPGDIALQAALHPAAGSWLYFVTVDLDSGQTVFSTTYAEHQKAVAQFQSWLRAHPEYDK